MDPMIIILICAASFGVVVTLAAFIRHLLLSRDKTINDEAQRKALNQEVAKLDQMREDMQSTKRFDSHYKMLGENKEEIIGLDSKIDELLHKKVALIDRYTQLSVKESEAIVNGQSATVRKEACDRLRKEIDQEIIFYDKEILDLQQRRKTLWNTHTELQEHLLKQEQARNAGLDEIYKQHSTLLEKIYFRHIDNSERVALRTINAGSSFFQSAILAPIQFLMSYFNASTGITLVQANIESAQRAEVAQVEEELNSPQKELDNPERVSASI